jgi:ribosomal protein L21E
LVKEKEILKEVTITTDKREYEQGEEVKITVENISNKEIKISLPYYIYGIEKLMAGEWKNLATNKCDCPEIECKVSPSYFLLPAGEKFELKWDQKEIKCDTLEFIQVSVGKYRAYTIVVEKERAKRIYSNEFTIKEKPEVTILTDKKEYEQGEVVRITMQNNTNKIVEFLSGKDDKKYQYECGYGCWGFIEIFKNGTWHKIDALPRCPCGAKCRVATPYPILSSNESFTIYWNQLIVDCSSIKDYKTRKASFGQYRITAKVKLNDGAPQTIYSNEFTIK